MATSKKKRAVTLYEDDGVLVEQTYATDSVEVMKTSRAMAMQNVSKEIKASDLIETLAAYTLPKFGINSVDDGAGECVICGAKTQYRKRKMCVDCIDRYGASDLLEKLKYAIDGDSTVYLD